MRRYLATLGVALIAIGSAADAAAQVEVGVGGAMFLITDGSDGASTAGLDTRVTIPLAPRVAIEGGLTFLPSEPSVIGGIYAAGVKQRIGPIRPEREVFLTYTGMGLLAYQKAYTSSSVDSRGTVHVFQRPGRFEGSVPVIGAFGIGMQRPIKPRLAIRLDGQLFVSTYGFGSRGSATVSVPFGRY